MTTEIIKQIIDSQVHRIESSTFCVHCHGFTDKTIVPMDDVIHVLCHECLTDDPDIVIHDNGQMVNLPFQCHGICYGFDKTKNILDKNKVSYEPSQQEKSSEKNQGVRSREDQLRRDSLNSVDSGE